jgi:hypothetical protein
MGMISAGNFEGDPERDCFAAIEMIKIPRYVRIPENCTILQTGRAQGSWEE